jgi:hypothetical protein
MTVAYVLIIAYILEDVRQFVHAFCRHNALLALNDDRECHAKENLDAFVEETIPNA